MQHLYLLSLAIKNLFNWASEKNSPTSKWEGISPMKVGEEFSVGLSQNIVLSLGAGTALIAW